MIKFSNILILFMLVLTGCQNPNRNNNSQIEPTERLSDKNKSDKILRQEIISTLENKDVDSEIKEDYIRISFDSFNPT